MRRNPEMEQMGRMAVMAAMRDGELLEVMVGKVAMSQFSSKKKTRIY